MEKLREFDKDAKGCRLQGGRRRADQVRTRNYMRWRVLVQLVA
jgi:hypothetical protein